MLLYSSIDYKSVLFFCNSGLKLSLKKLNDRKADDVYRTLMTAPIVYCWGTVSEFYGPNATPNGHSLNPFSTGILGEALIRYAIGFN